MRRLLAIVMGVWFGLVGVAWADGIDFNAKTSIAEKEIIAIIGQKTFERLDTDYEKPVSGCKTDENGEEKCSFYLHVKDRYQTRFKVIRNLSDHELGEYLDFHSFGEYGPPHENMSGPAVVFVTRMKTGDGTFLLSGYARRSAYRTSDGDWAVCADRQNLNPKNPQHWPKVEALSFVDTIVLDIPADYVQPAKEDIRLGFPRSEEDKAAHNRAYLDRLYQPPIWKRDGNKATCQMGTRAADLYAFRKRSHIKYVRRVMCNEKMGEPLNVIVGTGSSEASKERGKVHAICMEELAFKNLP